MRLSGQRPWAPPQDPSKSTDRSPICGRPPPSEAESPFSMENDLISWVAVVPSPGRLAVSRARPPHHRRPQSPHPARRTLQEGRTVEALRPPPGHFPLTPVPREVEQRGAGVRLGMEVMGPGEAAEWHVSWPRGRVTFGILTRPASAGVQESRGTVPSLVPPEGKDRDPGPGRSRAAAPQRGAAFEEGPGARHCGSTRSTGSSSSHAPRSSDGP